MDEKMDEDDDVEERAASSNPNHTRSITSDQQSVSGSEHDTRSRGVIAPAQSITDNGTHNLNDGRAIVVSRSCRRRDISRHEDHEEIRLGRRRRLSAGSDNGVAVDAEESDMDGASVTALFVFQPTDEAMDERLIDRVNPVPQLNGEDLICRRLFYGSRRRC